MCVCVPFRSGSKNVHHGQEDDGVCVCRRSIRTRIPVQVHATAIDATSHDITVLEIMKWTMVSLKFKSCHIEYLKHKCTQINHDVMNYNDNGNVKITRERVHGAVLCVYCSVYKAIKKLMRNEWDMPEENGSKCVISKWICHRDIAIPSIQNNMERKSCSKLRKAITWLSSRWCWCNLHQIRLACAIEGEGERKDERVKKKRNANNCWPGTSGFNAIRYIHCRIDIVECTYIVWAIYRYVRKTQPLNAAWIDR